MVGAVRFELTTSCTRNKRATRLRYAPTPRQEKVPVDASIGKKFIAPRLFSEAWNGKTSWDLSAEASSLP